MKLSRLFTVTIFFLTTFCCGTTFAAAVNIYQVEVIIFSRITRKALNSEKWPLIKVEKINYLHARSLKPVSSNNTTDYFALLPSKAFRLKNEQERLNKNPNYQTLLHIAWRQPIYEPRYAQTVRIDGGQYIKGAIKLSVRRYFDLKLDLTFAEPSRKLVRMADNDYFSQQENNVFYFRLHQKRRMRSNELNYIDFPLYGVLVKITPVKESNNHADSHG